MKAKCFWQGGGGHCTKRERVSVVCVGVGGGGVMVLHKEVYTDVRKNGV